MMTPDQLRALADALRPMAAAPRFDGIDIDRAADYLRACADAVPVAWLLRSKTRRNTDGDLFIRGCYGTPRTKQDYEFAELDGDEYIELVARPAPAAPQAEPKCYPHIEVSLAAGHGYWGVAICIGVQSFALSAEFTTLTEADEYAERLRTALGITGGSDAE